MRPTREVRNRAVLSSGLGGSTAAADAGDVTVIDAGDYYAGTNVEDVLQEIGAIINGHVEVVPSSGGAVDLDYETARYWDIYLDDDCALTISNAPADQTWGQLIVILRQGTGAPYTVTWPAEVQWQDTDGTAGGSAPTLWTTEDAIDVVTLVSVDGGLTWGGNHDAVALDDLTDVTITSPQEDDDLRFNGSLWVNDARKWEAVTNGEDVFVWEGDDLVHEWSA